jgi:hypothetical protein
MVHIESLYNLSSILVLSRWKNWRNWMVGTILVASPSLVIWGLETSRSILRHQIVLGPKLSRSILRNQKTFFRVKIL